MTGKRFHILSLLATALGLFLFFSNLSRFFYIREFVKAVNTLVTPLLEFKEHVFSEAKEEIGAYFRLVGVEKENIKLRRKVNSLLLSEKELKACLSELETLREKIGLTTEFGRLKYSVSRIIYYDPSGFDLFVIIKGGKDKGFKEGDLVVSERAVVGVIEPVLGSTSRVITPFNEKFSLSAVVGKRKKRYIYKGGYPLGDLLHVNVEDKVTKGEKVFLVGMKRKIPPFLIGRVEEVSRGKDPFFKRVKVKPAVDPRAEEYIYVIRR